MDVLGLVFRACDMIEGISRALGCIIGVLSACCRHFSSKQEKQEITEKLVQHQMDNSNKV